MWVFQAKAAKITGGVAVAAVVAVVGYSLANRDTPVIEAAQTPVQTETMPSEPKQQVPEAAQPAAPSFDEVRRDPDGMTVIAGRAAPGSDVSVVSNGVEIAATKADSAGKFAALAVLPPDGKGQVLSLKASDKGSDVASLDEVILAPLAPVPVAVVPADIADHQTRAPAEKAQPEPVVAAEAATKDTPQQQVALLKSTSDGVELLASSAPQVTGSLALDTITYSDAGDVRLAGRAQTEGTSVQVYLDNASVGKLVVDEEGRWRGDIDDIDTGIYTLRMDELNKDGDVISRVETPFKRESPEVLARATQGHDGPIKAVTVQEGATLWAIARERYGDPTLYVRVVEANRDTIRDPDLIYPGQVFALPN